MTSALEAAYRARLERGEIRPDPAQAAALLIPSPAALPADAA